MTLNVNTELVTFGFGIGLPIATYLYFIWHARPRWIRAAPPPNVGEDPKPPQDVPAPLAGLFLDGKIGVPEFAATILDLLIGNHIGLVDKGERIVVLRHKSSDKLPFFPRVIAHHLLTKGTLAKSDLEIERRINRKLYDAHISDAIRTLYNEALEHKVFIEDPNSRYAWYYLVGLLFFFLGVGTLISLLKVVNDLPLLLFFPLGLILSGTTIISRARHLPSMSQAGRLIQEVWHDYRKELATFRPRKAETYIEFLPYAVALGVEKEWTARFAHLPFTPPDWFATFKAPSREMFLAQVHGVVFALARDLFALRDPALKD